MDAKIIQRYRKKSVQQLISTATLHFNAYIRERDTDSNGFGTCISSGRNVSTSIKTSQGQAGHYYPAGNFPRLRFDEDNVHLQSKSDNYFKSGNLTFYRRNLIKKIGEERVIRLDVIADDTTPFKWDRIFLIEIIEKYRSLTKEMRAKKVIGNVKERNKRATKVF